MFNIIATPPNLNVEKYVVVVGIARNEHIVDK